MVTTIEWIFYLCTPRVDRQVSSAVLYSPFFQNKLPIPALCAIYTGTDYAHVNRPTRFLLVHEMPPGFVNTSKS